MGLFVNKMKTHVDSNVSKLAKDIVRDWKAQVAKETAATGSSTSTSLGSIKLGGPKTSGNTGSSANAYSNSSVTGRPTIDTKPSLTTTYQPQSSSREGSSTASSPQTPTDTLKDRTVRSDGMRIKTTGNDVRDRCIEMLYQALGTNSNAGALLAKEAFCGRSYIFMC